MGDGGWGGAWNPGTKSYDVFVFESLLVNTVYTALLRHRWLITCSLCCSAVTGPGGGQAPGTAKPPVLPRSLTEQAEEVHVAPGAGVSPRQFPICRPTRLQEAPQGHGGRRRFYPATLLLGRRSIAACVTEFPA